MNDQNNLFLYIHKWVSILDLIILWEKLYGLCQLSISGLRWTNKNLSNGVKDLIKCLLNDLVINNTKWPDIRLNKRPIYRVPVDVLVQSNTFSLIDTTLWMDGLTYNDKGQAKCFCSRNLSRFLNKSVGNQLQTSLTKRPKNWAWAYLHQLPTLTTRIPAIHKVILPAVHLVGHFS